MAVYAGPDIVENGLVLHLDAANLRSYPGTGTTWNNLTSSVITGTLVNGPTFSGANQGNIIFDGSNDYVELGDVLDLGTNDRTIICWISLNSSFSSTGLLVSKARAAAQNYRFALMVLTNKNLRTFVQGNGGADVETDGDDILLTNTPYMVSSIIKRDSNISMYVNTRLQTLSGSSTISQWNGLDFQSNNPFRVGTYTSADNTTPSFLFNGNIACVSVYDRALTSSEIQQNFNALRGRFNI
jgi:hypothetical protein